MLAFIRNNSLALFILRLRKRNLRERLYAFKEQRIQNTWNSFKLHLA